MGTSLWRSVSIHFQAALGCLWFRQPEKAVGSISRKAVANNARRLRQRWQVRCGQCLTRRPLRPHRCAKGRQFRIAIGWNKRCDRDAGSHRAQPAFDFAPTPARTRRALWECACRQAGLETAQVSTRCGCRLPNKSPPKTS